MIINALGTVIRPITGNLDATDADDGKFTKLPKPNFSNF